MNKPWCSLSTILPLLLLGMGPLALGGNPPAPFSRSPYVQAVSPHQITIVWRTEGPMTPVVRAGLTPGNLNLVVSRGSVIERASLGKKESEVPAHWKSVRTPKNIALPKLHSAPIGTFQYEAKITALKPSTTYYYAVYDGTKRLTPESVEYQFITQPEAGTRRPYRFWVLGDSGTGRSSQKAVHDAMLGFIKQDAKPLDFWIHVGDMAYGTGQDTEFQTRFFESYEPTLRSSVCWPTMGNHEGSTSKGTTGVGPYYDAYVMPTQGESGGVASGTEAYFSFNHGNIHFICLDSHDLDRKPEGAMAKWLKADLDKAHSDWLIAFWHHPPYTKGSHDSDKEKDLIEMRSYILPIIEAGGVDLVLTGHSHIYERSMLIDGAYSTNATTAETFVLDDGDGGPNSDGAYRKSAGLNPHLGTVQVVTGHSGQSLGRTGTSPLMRRTILEHGSVLIDVDGDTLTGRMINKNGTERDVFSIIKRGTVAVNRLPLPWQPPEYKKPSSTPSSTAEAPLDFRVLIPRGAEWSYSTSATSKGSLWTLIDFDASDWKVAPAAFGRGQGVFATPLAGGRNGPRSLCVRREFQIIQTDRITELGLRINYADAFIAYINGREVARVGAGRGNGRNIQHLNPREGSGVQYFALKNPGSALRNGTNVFAIECHAASEDSLDFLLDPELIAED